jgi:lysylphosphatidylglycerol synthetase-like protein (DUF2156 family)
MRTEKIRPISRPRSLNIAALLQALQGMAMLAGGVSYLVITHGGWQARLPGYRFLPFALIDRLSSAPVALGVGVLLLLSALALWRLSSLAWTLAIALQGINLLLALVDYLRHQPHYLAMVMGILLVLYLNQYEVLMAFRMRLAE